MSNRVNLTLDVTKTGIQNPLIKVRQGDGGFETLRTTVTANGEPLDLQGWTVTFMGTTAGNHKIVDGNVTFVEAPNGIFDYTPSKAWGMDIGEFNIAYFKFVKGDGSASSANFRVNVIEAVDMTQEEAHNYISVVDTTIATINQHLNDSLASVTKSIADANNNANTVASNVNSLGNRVDDYNNKLAAIKVGGRNLLLDTGRSFTGIGTNSVNGTFNDQGGQYYLAGGKKVSDIYNQYGQSEYLTLSFDWVASGSVISGEFLPQWNNTPWGGLSDAGNIKISNTKTSGHYVNTVSLNKDGYSTGNATGIRFRQDNLQGNVTISNVKLEAGNVSTDWSPAPEDMVAKSENAYFKNARILPADARDFAIIASDTIKYQGIWYTDGNVIANGPTSNWSWSTIEVLGGFGSGSGVIRTAAFPNSQEYITTVNSGKIVGWKKVADDTNVVHKTGTETIAGDKTFTSPINGQLSGNAATATKWQTARTLALTGDVTGSVAMDGSNNVSIATTGANFVHNTGNETIEGDKTFTGNINFTGDVAQKTFTATGNGNGITWTAHRNGNFVFLTIQGTTAALTSAGSFMSGFRVNEGIRPVDTATNAIRIGSVSTSTGALRNDGTITFNTDVPASVIVVGSFSYSIS